MPEITYILAQFVQRKPKLKVLLSVIKHRFWWILDIFTVVIFCIFLTISARTYYKSQLGKWVKNLYYCSTSRIFFHPDCQKSLWWLWKYFHISCRCWLNDLMDSLKIAVYLFSRKSDVLSCDMRGTRCGYNLRKPVSCGNKIILLYYYSFICVCLSSDQAHDGLHWAGGQREGRRNWCKGINTLHITTHRSGQRLKWTINQVFRHFYVIMSKSTVEELGK